MNRFFSSIFIIIFSLFLLAGCANNQKQNVSSNNSSNQSAANSYEAESLSLSNVIADNNVNDTKPIEETINTFSTNILDKSSGRQTNIELTCSTLNGTIVKQGETFSFCDTVGKATPERGYEKAKVFDADGKVTMGYGGGNCQVSSTLYNAVLQNPNFSIVERHSHPQEVAYVPKDKDASVACGSVDFKFKNNNNFDIRIVASTNGDQITVSIVKI